MLKHYKNKNWVGTTNYEQNLQDIKQDVETLKRNVSYIYKHGTLGGGGTGTGGGVVSDDQIILNYTTTLVSNSGSNICYTDSNGICNFSFYIKTQTTVKPYDVKITDDKGLVLKSEFTVTSSKILNEIKVNLIGLVSTEKIIISAVDKDGIELSPVIIYIRCNQYSVSLTQSNAQSVMNITNIDQDASRFNISTSCYIPNATSANISVFINGQNCKNIDVSTRGTNTLHYTFGYLFSEGFGKGRKPTIGQQYTITVTFTVMTSTNEKFDVTTNPYSITILGSSALGLIATIANTSQTNLLSNGSTILYTGESYKFTGNGIDELLAELNDTTNKFTSPSLIKAAEQNYINYSELESSEGGVSSFNTTFRIFAPEKYTNNFVNVTLFAHYFIENNGTVEHKIDKLYPKNTASANIRKNTETNLKIDFPGALTSFKFGNNSINYIIIEICASIIDSTSDEQYASAFFISNLKKYDFKIPTFEKQISKHILYRFIAGDTNSTEFKESPDADVYAGLETIDTNLLRQKWTYKTTWTNNEDLLYSGEYSGEIEDIVYTQWIDTKIDIAYGQSITSFTGTKNQELSSITSYRLANKAYFKITPIDGYLPYCLQQTKDGGHEYVDFYNKLDDGFTFSFNYRADKHSSENLPVLDITEYNGESEEPEILKINLNELKFQFEATQLNSDNSESPSKQQLSIKLSQEFDNFIDIVCTMQAVKIYLNGVLTTAFIGGERQYYDSDNLEKIATFNIQLDSLLKKFTTNNLYIATNKDTSSFTDIDLYGVALYKKALNDFEIIQNYISNKYFALNNVESNDAIEIVNNIRNRNFITFEDGKELCPFYMQTIAGTDSDFNVTPLYNSSNGGDVPNIGFKDANNISLYSTLKTNTNTPIPIIKLTVSKTVTDDVFSIIHTPSPLRTPEWTLSEIEYTFKTDSSNSSSESIKLVDDGTNVDYTGTNGKAPWFSMQGTSTLNYSSKNFEICFGKNSNGEEILFSPKSTWLPENKFTLKADTMDSAHTNNAAIGKFINENCFKTLKTTLEDKSDPNSTLIKPCLEGFPVLLFIEYGASSADSYPGLGTSSIPQFMGIYSFNLGRNSFYNMGYKKLGPTCGKYESFANLKAGSSTESAECYITTSNGSTNKTAYCFEFTNNDDKAGSFQSDDDSVINAYFEQKYPSNSNWTLASADAKTSLKDLFEKFANAYDSTTYTDNTSENSKWIMDGKTPKLVKDVYYPGGTAYADLFNNTTNNANTINFETANEYFLIAMAFGMVDSLHKNMQLRTWSTTANNWTGEWHTCFYDMDSCLGLDNNGYESIWPTASINHYENYTGETKNRINIVYSVRAGGTTSGLTIYSENYKKFIDATSQYSVANNRLFRILTYSGPSAKIRGFTDTATIDGHFFSNPNWYVNKWINWRKFGGILESYKKFYENYFEAQNDKVGELLFNLDYYIKYIQPVNSDCNAYKDVRSLQFLHGRRLGYVKSWLEKRLAFLDSIFLYDYHNFAGTDYRYSGNSDVTSALSTVSYLNRSNLEIKDQASIDLTATTAHPGILYLVYNDDIEGPVNNTSFRFISDADTPTPIKLSDTGGQSNQFFINYSNSISKIERFNEIKFKSLAKLDMPNLEEFDLSNVFSITDIGQVNDNPFGTTTESIFNLMPKLKVLNISGSTAKNPFVINVRDCTKLHTIDISKSSTSTLTLSEDETALTTLNISGSEITKLKIINKSLLTELDCSNCTSLQEIYIENAPSLKTIKGLTGLNNLKTINIIDCINLLYIDIKACKTLSVVSVENCPRLQVFGCQCSGENSAEGIDIDISKIGMYKDITNTYKEYTSTELVLQLQKVCIYNCLIKDDVVYLPYESFAKINYLNITASNIAAIGISKISTDKKSIEKKYPQTANSEKILDLSLIYNGEFTASAEKDQTKLTTELLKGSETEYCYTLLSADNEITTDTGLYINGITAVVKDGTYYEIQTDSAGNRKSVFVQPFKTSTVQYIKVNNNDKDNPFVLTTDKFFYGIFKGSNACVGTRILGHIKLSGSYNYSFNMNELKGKFYINPESLYETNGMYKACGNYKSSNDEYGVIPKSISSPTAGDDGEYEAYTGENGLNSYKKFVANSIDYKDSKNMYVYAGEIDIDKVATNISFDSGLTDWTKIFAGTAINIQDLYYIMARATNATNLTFAFLACYNLEATEEHPLCRYTFSECKSVTTINGVFCKAFKTFQTPLYSSEYWTSTSRPKRPKNGLLAPLSTKCTNIMCWCSPLWNLTGTRGNCYIDDKFFMDLSAVTKMDRIFPSNAASIVDTNKLDRTHAKLHSMYLFANNTNITSVNGCMNYANEYHNYTYPSSYPSSYLELYIGELKVYKTTNCSGNSKTIRALFHQNSALTGVDNFSGYIDQNGKSNLFISGKITSTIFGGGVDSDYKYWKLPNGVLKTISYSSTITNYYHFIHNSHESSTLKLDWANFNNLFNNIQPKSSITNCSAMWDAVWNKTGSAFPTKIFYGMTNVVSVARFFKNHGIKNSSSPNNLLELPGNMFQDCTSLTTVEECFRNDTLPSDFYFRLSSSDPRYFYKKIENPGSTDSISVECSEGYTNFKNIDNNLNVYALFQNAGTIVSKTTGNKVIYDQDTDNFIIEYTAEYSGIPSRFFELKNNHKITNMSYCFSGLYSLHNIRASYYYSGEYPTYYNNPIIDYSKPPKINLQNEIVWDYKDIEAEATNTARSTSFICNNPSINSKETSVSYSPHTKTWNRYAWDGLYKQEFDLLDPNNFIYAGEKYDYDSYYGELYPIGKTTGTSESIYINGCTGCKVYNATNEYTALYDTAKKDISTNLMTYATKPTEKLVPEATDFKLTQTVGIKTIQQNGVPKFIYETSQNYIVCDISKYAKYNSCYTEYALGAIPISVSIKLNEKIADTDIIECFYLGDVINNNYVNIKPLSAEVRHPIMIKTETETKTENSIAGSKTQTGYKYEFTFSDFKERVRYIVFRLRATESDIKFSPSDCFTYDNNENKYYVNNALADDHKTPVEENGVTQYILNTTNIITDGASTKTYTISNISISFYPMGYNYNKLNDFNLYKYGPFIKEYNSNADRIVSGTGNIQTLNTDKNINELSTISSYGSDSSSCWKITSKEKGEFKTFSSSNDIAYTDNYIVPPDLFYYCLKSCTIDYVLSDLYKTPIENTYYNHNFGRLPPVLFESLTETTSFAGVFENNRLAITPYFIPYKLTTADYEDPFNSGLMYPTDLFKKNTAMTTLSKAFANTVVAYNCVLSGQAAGYYGLLENNAALTNVSCTFANIHYFGRDITNLSEWERIFYGNKKLSNLSGCFAQSNGTFGLPSALGVTKIYGFSNLLSSGSSTDPTLPTHIDHVFKTNGQLHNPNTIANITYMFYNQTNLDTGNLPNFKSLRLSQTNYQSCFGGLDFSGSGNFGTTYKNTYDDISWTTRVS